MMAPNSMNPTTFLCPECGSAKSGGAIHVTTVPAANDPWSEVLHRIHCADCHSVIPAHLAQLWDNLSPADAQKQWQEIYRDTIPRPRRH